jgi:hypothetical protein
MTSFMDVRWDFFIAHAGRDTEAAEGLYRLLAPRSRPFLDTQCLRPGEDWDRAIPTAQRTSAVTVVLLSAQTDRAYYQREEVASAIDLARRGGGTHTVVPVYLDQNAWEAHDVPYGLRLLTSLSVPSLGMGGVADRLLELLYAGGDGSVWEPSASSTLDIAPSLATSAWFVSLPSEPRYFVGRERELDHIKELLGVGAEARQVRVQALTAVHGLPGIGKTTLANRLSHDPEVHATFVDGVLWGAIGPSPNLLARVAGWGDVLGSQEMLGAGMLRQALDALRQRLRGKRMLVVLDDVWEVEHAAPIIHACSADCALLVTTRAPGVVDRLSVPADAVSQVAPLSSDEALGLLGLLVPPVVQARPEACARLVADLGYLPLAIHVAGGLLREEERMGWGVDDLLDDLSTSTALLSAKAPMDTMDRDTAALPTVAALIERSVAHLPTDLKTAFAGLGAFAAQPATFSLDELRVVWMTDDPRSLLRGLVTRGLVEPRGPGSFQVHPLLSMYARSLLDG